VITLAVIVLLISTRPLYSSLKAGFCINFLGMKFILIYITHANLPSAKKLCNQLLKDRLIACVNYFPIESAYWWKGTIEESKEIVSLVKTNSKNWLKVQNIVTKAHPYETPCIMKVTVEANTAYGKWINEMTS